MWINLKVVKSHYFKYVFMGICVIYLRYYYGADTYSIYNTHNRYAIMDNLKMYILNSTYLATMSETNPVERWLRNETRDLIYYGMNQEIAQKYNTPEMMKKYRHPTNSTLMKRFPQCIGIGAAKCGTTAILRFLDYHPSIATSEVYETIFFHQRVRTDLEYYLQNMKYSEKTQISFEKSPHYFWDPQSFRKIYNFDPSIKLLLAVRNPVRRVFSDYISFHSKRKLPLEHFIFNKNGSIYFSNQGSQDFPGSTIGVGMYHQYISNWLTLFNKSQIHIIDGDKLLTNPASELGKIEDFLNIEHYLTVDKFNWNETKGYYCFKTEDMPSDFCLNRGSIRQDASIADTVKQYNIPLKPGSNITTIISKLKTFFRPHNKKFFEMVGQSFDWD